MTAPEHSPAYDIRPEAIRERIKFFSDFFEVEPVTVRCAGGKALFTDEFQSWCAKNGASIDWIVMGDPTPMMSVFRLACLVKVERTGRNAG